MLHGAGNKRANPGAQEGAKVRLAMAKMWMVHAESARHARIDTDLTTKTPVVRRNSIRTKKLAA